MEGEGLVEGIEEERGPKIVDYQNTQIKEGKEEKESLRVAHGQWNEMHSH